VPVIHRIIENLHICANPQVNYYTLIAMSGAARRLGTTFPIDLPLFLRFGSARLQVEVGILDLCTAMMETSHTDITVLESFEGLLDLAKNLLTDGTLQQRIKSVEFLSSCLCIGSCFNDFEKFLVDSKVVEEVVSLLHSDLGGSEKLIVLDLLSQVVKRLQILGYDMSRQDAVTDQFVNIDFDGLIEEIGGIETDIDSVHMILAEIMEFVNSSDK
jgi:hypothetical protein